MSLIVSSLYVTEQRVRTMLYISSSRLTIIQELTFFVCGLRLFMSLSPP
jgi:hypothetical protein